MKTVAQKYKGEIVVSLFRQEALKDWGIKMYSKITEMIGKPDLEKTYFEKGLFVSETGYTSKWWNTAEIEKMKEFFGGKLINEVLTPHFVIIQLLPRQLHAASVWWKWNETEKPDW